MYAPKSSAGHGRERAPYAALRQSQNHSDCGCAAAPVASYPAPAPSCLQGYPLAMVYAPAQPFENIYDRDAWLARGTIFKALDFPFKGAGKGR